MSGICRKCGCRIECDDGEDFCVACMLEAGMGSAKDAENDDGIEGKLLGDYELLEQLARGGQGTVYLARHRETGREVALKTVDHVWLPNEEGCKRFRDESTRASCLEHPNIIRVYETGECEGRWFYVMEYAAGGSLAQPRAALSKDPRNVALLGVKIARAIAHAHENMLLHRDLKPENILLDSHGEPKVCDFGLGQDMEETTRLTRTGMLLGTPVYMAPEMTTGSSKSSVKTDIYGIGAILYELLAGRAPFRAEVWHEVLQRVREQDPDRLRSINREVNRDLEIIIHKCLSKEPIHRYRDAASLADDLDRWLRKEPITARPASPMYVMVKWLRRHPWQATAAVITAALLGVAGLYWSAQREQRLANQQLDADDFSAVLRLINVGEMDRSRWHLERLRSRSIHANSWLQKFADVKTSSHDGALTASEHGAKIHTCRFASDGFLYIGGEGFFRQAKEGEWVFTDVILRDSANVITMECSKAVRKSDSIAPMKEPVTHIAVSNDGKLMAVTRVGWGLELIDRVKMLVIARLPIPVNQSHFANGRLLVSFATDGGFAIFGENDWRELCYEPDASGVAAFVSDGEYIIGGNDKYFLRLWKTVDQADRVVLEIVKEGEASNVGAPDRLDLDPNHQWFASSHEGGEISYFNSQKMLLDPNEKEFVVENNHGNRGQLRVGAFSPDGNHFIHAYNGNLRYWSMSDDPYLIDEVIMRGNRNSITDVAWSSSGKYFSSADANGRLCVWEADRLTQVPPPIPDDAAVVSSNNATTVAWQDNDKLELINETNNRSMFSNQVGILAGISDNGRAYYVRKMPDATLTLAIIAPDRNEQTLLPLRNGSGGSLNQWQARCMEDQHLILHDSSGTWLCYSLNNGSLQYELADVDAYASHVENGATIIYVAKTDGSIAKHNLTNQTHVETITQVDPARIQVLAISSNGDHLAYAHRGQSTVRVISTESQKPSGVVFASLQPVQHMAFSRDDQFIAVACAESPLHLVHLPSMRYLGVLPDADDGPWKMITFSQDGKDLIAAGRKLHRLSVANNPMKKQKP